MPCSARGWCRLPRGGGWTHRVTSVDELTTALETAVAGDRVLVAKGTYLFSKTLAITNAITVIGETGDPTDVVLDAQSQCLAVKISDSGALLSSVTVTRGSYAGSDYKAAGIYNIGGTVSNCVAIANRTTGNMGYGAGIYNNNGKVFDCVMTGNSGAKRPSGAGLYQEGASAVTERCIITNNGTTAHITGTGGGEATMGAHINGGKIRSSLIADNYINYTRGTDTQYVTSGLYVQAGSVDSCTIIGNTVQAYSTVVPYGLRVASKSIVVKNTLITNNRLSSGEDNNYRSGMAGTFNNCCTTGADSLGGSGNIEYADNIYILTDGIPVPTTGSLLIDRGAAVDADHLLDLVKNDRTNGTAPDIGCIEYEPPPLGVVFVPSQTMGLDSLKATLTSTVEGDLQGLCYYWDLDGDGVADEEGADKSSVVLTLDEIGSVVVTLRVTNTAGNAAEWKESFSVHPSRLYVVTENQNAKEPYNTWATAATNIHDAVAMAADGATVIITNGTYKYASTLHVGKGITIRSATDNPDDVILDTQYNCLAVKITNADAVIRALSITKGNIGIHIEPDGTVTNCIVRDNTNKANMSEGAGIINAGGKVYDCVIRGNAGQYRGYGYGLYQTGSGAVTDRCTITNNCSVKAKYSGTGLSYPGVYVTGGAIRNSLIAYNNVDYTDTEVGGPLVTSGLYAKSCVVENCTIVSNLITHYEALRPIGVRTEAGAVIKNTLIADNNLTTGVPVNWATSANVSYINCCTTDAASLPGEGNVECTPKAYRIVRGLPMPTLNSPLYDGGVDTDLPYDLLGNPRRYLGRKTDIGAIELQRGKATIIILR